MRIPMLIAVSVAALALVAAGCGGGDSEEASDEAVVEETSTVEEEESDDSMAEEEEEEEDDLSTSEDDVDLSDFSGSPECLELASIGSKIAQSMGTTGTADYDELSGFFDELASEAPDEIQGDLEVLAEAWSEIADVLENTDLGSGQAPSPEALAELQSLGEKLDNPELQQASENLSAWAQENCGG